MVKKYKLRKYLITSSIISIIIALIGLISPFIMGLIIDDYIPNQNIQGLIIGIILFILLPFISVGLNLLYNYIMIKIVRNKGNELSLDIMSNLIYQEYSYFDRENSLELLSYVSKETVGYLNFYMIDLPNYYINILISLAILLISIVINPILGAIQILYIPLVLFPMKKIINSTGKEIEIVVENNAKMNQIKGDVFKAIEFIKLNRIEDKKLEEVKRANQNINKIWGKVAVLDTLTGIWSSGFMTLLFTGLTFGLGALFIFNDMFSFSLGSLVSIITYVALYYTKINTILNTKVNKKKEDAKFKQVISYLNLTGEKEENKDLDKFKFYNSIKFNNLNFSYTDDKIILENLNLEIIHNKWTSIIGETGSGKSTLFDLILKLYKVKRSELLIDNKDILNINSFSIRENITKISQDIYLFPGTILDNLKLIKEDISIKEINEALEFACLKKFVDDLPKGINTEIGEAGKLMSGGERQRLSIAMGILRGNKILLLDEVTSNLDLDTTLKIENNFKSLINKSYTIVSISHNKEFLNQSDFIYEIKDKKAIRVK